MGRGVCFVCRFVTVVSCFEAPTANSQKDPPNVGCPISYGVGLSGCSECLLGGNTLSLYDHCQQENRSSQQFSAG
jgi:hypothetical protein